MRSKQLWASTSLALLLIFSLGCDDEFQNLDSRRSAEDGGLDPYDPRDPSDSDGGGALDDGEGDSGAGGVIPEPVIEPEADPEPVPSPSPEPGPAPEPDADPVPEPDGPPEPDPEPPEPDPEPPEPEPEPEDPVRLPDIAPLFLPGCGTFGPGEALRAGPAVLATYLHGTPGVFFGEPALAGCRVEVLSTGAPRHFHQEVRFTYVGDRVVDWNWIIGTPDGGFDRDAFVEYDGSGRVGIVQAGCPYGVGLAVRVHAYDRQGRLIELARRMDPDCYDRGEPAVDETVFYRYANDVDPLPVARITQTVALDGIGETREDYVYGYDDRERLVWQTTERRGARVGEGVELTYNRAGQVESVRILPTPGVERAAERTIGYRYDEGGRLVERVDGDDVLRITYRGDAGIAEVEYTNPRGIRRLGHPESSVFQPVALPRGE